ncbi:unnamed protein product, partial [Brachionus calyciflorus]
MYNLSFFLLIIALGQQAKSTSIRRGIDLLPGGTCLTDSNCRSSEYCNHKLINPFGECVKGDDEGSKCLMDRYCASKQCSFFTCKKRIQVKDGPCKKSADCLDTQYCDEIKGRDDLNQCFDRKCTGSCRKDSQCMSDKCHFFTCTKDNR